MSAQLLARRGLCATERRGAKGLSCGSGSRHAIVTFAKRGGGISKELRELQQLKEGAAAAPPPPAPAPTASSPAPAPATTTTPSPAPAAPASSPAAPAAATPSTPTTTTTTTTTSTTGGGGLADNLLVRILLSVTAIMAVIGVFYSIVFYAGSNFVYVFKDQLGSITKKDFVPYSERRRMEQEVLAKLEAENEARVAQRAAAAAAAAAASSEAGASEAAAEGGAEDNSELLNLLPGAGKR